MARTLAGAKPDLNFPWSARAEAMDACARVLLIATAMMQVDELPGAVNSSSAKRDHAETRAKATSLHPVPGRDDR